MRGKRPFSLGPDGDDPAGPLDHYAYGNKVRGAGEACRRQGIAFLPMAVESFGGWHEVAEREVRKLGAALARHTVQEESEAIGHLWGRLFNAKIGSASI